jgi:hypothetical protein
MDATANLRNLDSIANLLRNEARNRTLARSYEGTCGLRRGSVDLIKYLGLARTAHTGRKASPSKTARQVLTDIALGRVCDLVRFIF